MCISILRKLTVTQASSDTLVEQLARIHELLHDKQANFEIPLELLFLDVADAESMRLDSRHKPSSQLLKFKKWLLKQRRRLTRLKSLPSQDHAETERLISLIGDTIDSLERIKEIHWNLHLQRMEAEVPAGNVPSNPKSTTLSVYNTGRPSKYYILFNCFILILS